MDTEGTYIKQFNSGPIFDQLENNKNSIYQKSTEFNFWWKQIKFNFLPFGPLCLGSAHERIQSINFFTEIMLNSVLNTPLDQPQNKAQILKI